MKDDKRIAFTLRTPYGAELDLNISGVSDVQMKNIIESILKPNLNPETFLPHVEAIQHPLSSYNQEDVKLSQMMWENFKEEPDSEVLEEVAVSDEERKAAEELNKKLEEGNKVSTTHEFLESTKKNIRKGTKKLPFVSSSTTNNSMYDTLGEEKAGNLLKAFAAQPTQEEVPDFHHTGIKYGGVEGNTPKYRTFYKCPKCDQSGRHYIPETVKRISCHNCQQKLTVEPATDKGFGLTTEHRDEDGNYFVAYMMDYK